MASWIISALRLLAAGAIAGGAAGAIESATGIDIPFLGGSGGNGDKPRRRRRRRALTASDRADIGFIVGLLGPAAGGRFAVTLAAR